MRKTLSIVLVALVLAGVNLVQAGEDEARGIVKKAIEAMGGETKLAKHKAITFKEKGTYYGMGDGLPFNAVYSIQWPSQFRMEIEGVFTLVLNGDKGWIMSGGDTKEMSKEQLAQQRHDHCAAWMSTLLPLKDKAFTLKTLKDATIGKHQTRVVEATRKDYPTMKLYFDKTTNLLVKFEYKTTAAEMEFKEVTADTVYSDYREVAGAKVAHKMVMHRDGKVFVEAEVTEMTAEGKLDAKVFAMPK
jgi:hypothetical protein